MAATPPPSAPPPAAPPAPSAAPAAAPPVVTGLAVLSSATPPYRHVAGDLVFRFYTVTGNNGDTLTIPGMSVIYQADPVPTTTVAMGCTIAGNVVTFVSGGAFTATVMIVGREG